VQGVRIAFQGLNDRGAVFVAHLRHFAGDDLGATEHPTQRHHHVARRHRSGGGLRQERLVRHVGPGVDDRDDRLVVPQLLEQAQGRVEPDVPTAHDEDAGQLGLR
jgi:hypothetical protein